MQASELVLHDSKVGPELHSNWYLIQQSLPSLHIIPKPHVRQNTSCTLEDPSSQKFLKIHQIGYSKL